MKVIVDFTEETKAAVKAWFLQNTKHKHLDLDACIREALDAVSDRIEGKHEPEYELSSFDSKDGAPKLLGFTKNDFIYEIIEN